MKTKAENIAWGTKDDWAKWHYYSNSAMPLCGSLTFRLLLSSVYPIILCKKIPDRSIACVKCMRNGRQLGLWK